MFAPSKRNVVGHIQRNRHQACPHTPRPGRSSLPEPPPDPLTHRISTARTRWRTAPARPSCTPGCGRGGTHRPAARSQVLARDLDAPKATTRILRRLLHFRRFVLVLPSRCRRWRSWPRRRRWAGSGPRGLPRLPIKLHSFRDATSISLCWRLVGDAVFQGHPAATGRTGWLAPPLVFQNQRTHGGLVGGVVFVGDGGGLGPA